MPDIGDMLINLSQSYAGIWRLITSFSYVAGFIMFFRAIYNLKIYGELRTMMPSQASVKLPVTYMIVAAALLWLPSAVNVMMESTFGYTGPRQLLSHIAVDSIRGEQILRAVLGMVQIVGLIAFIRGWMILSQGAQQGSPQSFGKAITHMIGGIFALNIDGTWELLKGTFGIN